MEYLAQVQRGLDYIEANLDADVTSADVAQHAGISQWHFQRIFKALTNETLKAYIRSRRFSRALERLASSRDRVLDIALTSGFETQESFTRAFKDAFGMPPGTYRARAGELALLRKPRFDAEYLLHLREGVSLEPQFTDQPAFHVVGRRTRFFSVDSERNNIARKLPQLWAGFLPLLGDIPNRILGGCYGVIHNTSDRSDELEYWAAAPVTHVDGVPATLESREIPAARYARFAHRGHVSRMDLTVNYIYSSWLLRAGVRHTYGCDLEFYGKEYHPDSEQSVIYYAIPIST